MNRKNSKFDGFKRGRERFDFAIGLEVVARASPIVASRGEKYFEWFHSDIDGLDKALSEAGANVRAVDQLRRKAHDFHGQGGSFIFFLISQVVDALHKVMVSQDVILSVEADTSC